MGYYLNPHHRYSESGKTQWLNANATRLHFTPKWEELKEDMIYLCRVWNGSWSALGVAYDEREFDTFNYPKDNRAKEWWVAKREDVSNEYYSEVGITIPGLSEHAPKLKEEECEY